MIDLYNISEKRILFELLCEKLWGQEKTNPWDCVSAAEREEFRKIVLEMIDAESRG